MDKDGIEHLCRPAAFDHPTGEFTLRETHISWVILCGEYAYKVKKPVDFGFLDFSTIDRRKYYCEQELYLNRRFSPELYLDVVAITVMVILGPILSRKMPTGICIRAKA